MVYVHCIHTQNWMVVTEPAADATVAVSRRIDGRERTMAKVFQGLMTILALLKGGPGGHPIITHHHLHRE